ncbi:MAG: DNA mismatch repair endonuclease MutL [Eubacteriales bacterium]|nr:DNA mismatch repair endonuclease MutL [Eubacteriales bacterium]
MGTINVLSFAVANLIAAGEVVDRPASVIKELMENAIDAGATAITVEIRNGGVTLMRVTDNGCGMTPEDLPVAIRRHATSKIRCAADLDGIATLGFRGKALAAIASVSDLRILSRTKDAPYGAMLEAHGGEHVTVTEQGCSVGTSVLVENLFANVPARRKFLKKDITETMAVTAYVEKIALSNPGIAVRLITDGNLKLETAGDGSLRSAIYALFGRDYANRLIEVSGDSEGIEVSGFIGRTDNYKANRGGENFFVNGRYVKSKTAMAALEQAYTSYMPPEKFPCCVLFVTVSPARVDVNVHPAKLEVKFSNEKAIFDAVYYTVRTALEQNVTRPSLQLAGSRNSPNPFAFPGGKVSAATFPVENERTESLQRRQMSYDLGGRTQPQPDLRPAGERPQNPPPARVTAEEYRSMICGIPSGPAAKAAVSPAAPAAKTVPATISAPAPSAADSVPVAVPKPVSPEPQPTPEPEAAPENTAKTASDSAPESTPEAAPVDAPVRRDYRIIGSAFRAYVLVETGETLLLIDQHAAHERILFEQLKAGLHRASPVSQMLMIPVDVMMTTGEVEALRQYDSELKKIGYSLRYARNTVSADGIPEGVETGAVADMLSVMAGRLLDNTGSVKLTRDIIFEKALYQAACKAAIKAGRTYAEEHIAWIVAKLMELPDITFCPHGRPVAMELTKSTLDRQFDRSGF